MPIAARNGIVKVRRAPRRALVLLSKRNLKRADAVPASARAAAAGASVVGNAHVARPANIGRMPGMAEYMYESVMK